MIVQLYSVGSVFPYGMRMNFLKNSCIGSLLWHCWELVTYHETLMLNLNNIHFSLD